MAIDQNFCLTGCFPGNTPVKGDILEFKKHYGKKPAIVMFFIDWNHLIRPKILEDIKALSCIPMVTWEPWDMTTKQGIDYDGVLSGRYDAYLQQFAAQIRDYEKTLLLRFGHEMNGNWYPWAGVHIGKEKFIRLWRYLHDFLKKQNCVNVKWVLCFNKDSVPAENNRFEDYYPGDAYVDALGIDGYNWGDTQPWSRWESFHEIFKPAYDQLFSRYAKPIILCEFSSTSSGGDKAAWIREGMASLKQMPGIRGFVLFNILKETDWKFSQDEKCAREFRKILKKDDYFEQDYQRLEKLL